MVPSCLDRVTSVHLLGWARVVCRCVFHQLQKFEETCWVMTDFQPYVQYFNLEVLSTYTAQI